MSIDNNDSHNKKYYSKEIDWTKMEELWEKYQKEYGVKERSQEVPEKINEETSVSENIEYKDNKNHSNIHNGKEVTNYSKQYNKNGGNSSMRKVIATIIFWLCFILGPYAFSILNAVTPIKIEPGTTTFLITIIFLQSASAIVACFFANEYMKENNSLVVAVNAIIAASISGVFSILSIISGDYMGAFSDIITIIALIIQGIRPYFSKSK